MRPMVLVSLVCAFSVLATAQQLNSVAVAKEDAATNNEPDLVSMIDRGFSYLTSFAGSHDSSTGWSTTMTNTVHYDFSKHWNVEVGVPIYFLHNGTDASTVVPAGGSPPLDTTFNALGDMVISGGLTLPDSRLGYTATASVTAPTGSQDTGISTGQATVDFNNHFEHDFKWFTPSVELGIGNSSALINKKVKRPYTTLGPMAHFKAGITRSLFKGWGIEVDGYENLPIAETTIFSHVLRQSAHGKITRIGKDGKLRHFQLASVALGPSLAEDNGITSTLSGEIGRGVGLSFAYDRSLRQSLDTVSFTMTYHMGHQHPTSEAK